METNSHNSMINYPRFPISELHLGKFPDTMEFQSGKSSSGLSFSKSAYLHLTMHWIKEVEIAKSIDELMTSRSIIGRTDFLDFDMLDAFFCVCTDKTSQHTDTFSKE